MAQTALAMIVGTLAAMPVLAQDCMWKIAGQTPGSYGPATVYHTALGRVIAVDGDGRVSRWDGSTWTSLSSAAFPGRYGTSVCYDSARDRVVLFGGYAPSPNLTPYGQTWEWKGDQWMQVPVAGPPTTTTMRVMVFDAARGRSVLFHSVQNSTVANTWTYDGATWTVAATNGPPARTSHSMAYDSSRQRVVLYGGLGATSPYPLLQDVWEFDGATWVRRNDGPPGRQGHAMGYDSIRARIIMHGPVSSQSLPETWEYEPVADTWSLRAVAGPELNRREIAFDIPRKRGVSCRLTASQPAWEWNAIGAVSPIFISQYPGQLAVAPGGRAEFSVLAVCTGPMTYRWRKNGVVLANGGNISGADTATLVIDPVSSADQGHYAVTVSNGCLPVEGGEGELFVLGNPCYPNCDGSTVSPILTANDYMCFFNLWVTNGSYANCDGVGGLTAGDFICFLTGFNNGCVR